jgi:catalase-peroxidase
MGPRSRYLGDAAPSEALIWQDPIPAVEHKLVDKGDITSLKQAIKDSGLTVPELVRTAWASAASFRASDMRGGANGARIALAPQLDWEANNPAELKRVLAKLGDIQRDFNASKTGTGKVSLADLIVIAGAAGIEKAARDAGVDIEVPFTPGRADATQAQTDVASFALLEPKADAFRNYFNAAESYRSPTEMMIDRADQLDLTIPEMTALLGGLRALDANTGGSKHGVLTDNPGTLSNDFFVNLMDMSILWQKSGTEGLYEGVDRKTGAPRFTATPVDLIFGSNSELRAVAEVYAYDNAQERFIRDFVAAWSKVMQLDRFDLRHSL